MVDELRTQTNLSTINSILSDIRKGDIQPMGILLNCLDEMSLDMEDINHDLFMQLKHSITEYSHDIILEEKTDTQPILDGISLISGIVNDSLDNKTFDSNGLDVLKSLGFDPGKAVIVTPVSSSEFNADTHLPSDEEKQSHSEITEEDIQIIYDFITEARDNLDTIEINLISLEENPEDTSIIDDIFRPFHTIKGVSGFLDLKKINSLSHMTENLLDSVRQNKIEINARVTDIILKSVDILKKLLLCVEESLAENGLIDDHDIDIDPQLKGINEILTGEQQGSETNQNPEAEQITDPLGHILLEKGIIRQSELETGLTIQETNQNKKIGEILVEENYLDQNNLTKALTEQQKRRKETGQVKVDIQKLDSLVDLTGELVIAQSILKQNSDPAGNSPKFNQSMIQLGQIVSNLQKIAMSMRMVPIRTTFMKMIRLVRDLSKNCHKEIRLEMTGEETEIDRNVVDALYEPMVHMIRNSVDHGFETPEERLKKKKSPVGTITLMAYHKSGTIVIEISDDGKGLDRDKIISKAVQSGMIQPDDRLSDIEIDQLILRPGFSTSETITDISGRGVGMDVVVKSIENLRGSLEIQSRPGKGSTFIISLPLTLAIIDGMLLRVGNEKFIIPTLAILESFKPVQDDYHTVKGKGEMIHARGELIPLVRISDFFEIHSAENDLETGLVVVVENKQKKLALYLDEVMGKEEFVIKNLGDTLNHVKGLAGGAILGDGSVGLILDIVSLFEMTLTR